MNLAHLSIARVGNHRRVPHVPTREERMAAYRAATVAQFGNSSFNYGGGASDVTPSAANGLTGTATVASTQHTSPATCLLGCAASLTGSQQPFPQARGRPPSTPPHEAGGYPGINSDGA